MATYTGIMDANGSGRLPFFAGIDLQTGEAIPLVRETHTSDDYIRSLKKLDEKYPKGDKIRLGLDNLKQHTTEKTRQHLTTVLGSLELPVFTPQHVPWLNLIESFFSKMTRQLLHRINLFLNPRASLRNTYTQIF